MRVAGPPLVDAGRVYAPYCRMRGRIEYHVGCFELDSGRLLWSTWVVSGQGELNMFNRYLREFCAAPLVWSEGRLIAQTNLGVVAALDPDNGETLWSSSYDSIQQPPVRGMGEQRRPTVWRNAPPVATDGLVIAAPTDASELLVLDATDGRRLSALPHGRFSWDGAPGVYPAVLLGADRDGVWLGSAPDARPGPGLNGRWTLERGWRGGGALQATWAHPTRPEFDDAPRARLCGELLLVPGYGGPEWLDARTGAVRAAASDGWDRRATGNVLLAGEQLYSLSGAQLAACLDWSALLARALVRLNGAHPEGAVDELLSLREQRARSLARRERVEDALAELERARRDLAAAPARVRAPLERLETLALLEAEWLAGLGRADEARARLQTVLATASSPQRRLELELASFALIPTDRHDERAAALRALGELPGDLTLPTGAQAQHAQEIYGVGLGLPPAQRPAGDPALALATWCALMNAAAARGRGANEVALLALQDLLLAPQAEPDLAALELWPVVARSMRELAAGGAASLPPRYEAQAESELRALGAEPEVDELLALGRRHPLSNAARRARLDLCAAWQRSGDIARLAELARELRGTGAVPDTDERVVLRALGAAAGANGNPELARALERAIAGAPAAAGAGATAQPLGVENAAQLDAPLEARVELDLPSRLLGRFRASVTPDGGGDEPARAARELALVWRNGRIEAWSDQSSSDPVWVASLYSETPPQSTRVAAGRACFALDATLVALDLWSGDLAWRARVDDESEVALCALDGVLVATSIANGTALLSGFDARTGALLWRAASRERQPWRRPIAGDGKLALLAWSHTSAHLLVLDALRGVHLGEFELGIPLDGRAADESWIEVGRLCIPRFRGSRPVDSALVRAFSLQDGSLAFALRPEGGAELDALIEYAGERTLVTRMGRGAGADPSGALLAFSARDGTATPRLRLRYGERVLGAWGGSTLHVDTPFVCVFQGGAKLETPFTLVELSRGVRWLQRLPRAENDLDWEGVPAPLVGERGVLVAWRVDSRDGSARKLCLSLYDRESGASLWQGALEGPAAEFRELAWTAVGRGVLATLDEQRFHTWESHR
jgi:outer membrane protein assembly factor BamB